MRGRRDTELGGGLGAQSLEGEDPVGAWTCLPAPSATPSQGPGCPVTLSCLCFYISRHFWDPVTRPHSELWVDPRLLSRTSSLVWSQANILLAHGQCLPTSNVCYAVGTRAGLFSHRPWDNHCMTPELSPGSRPPCWLLLDPPVPLCPFYR
jgi:hypothetical protein